MIDTGSSINLKTTNFGENKEQEQKSKVHTINESSTKKSATYFHNDSFNKISKMYDQTRRHIDIYRF